MKNYEYTFKQIIENFNLFKLGTIIESEYGDKYKLTKTENDTRKFSRVNKGLRFMTYDNIDRNFRIVKEEQQDIDIQRIEEIEPPMNGNAQIIDNKTWTLNQVIKAVKQLDKQINLQSSKETK